VGAIKCSGKSSLGGEDDGGKWNNREKSRLVTVANEIGQNGVTHSGVERKERRRMTEHLGSARDLGGRRLKSSPMQSGRRD